MRLKIVLKTLKNDINDSKLGILYAHRFNKEYPNRLGRYKGVIYSAYRIETDELICFYVYRTKTQLVVKQQPVEEQDQKEAKMSKSPDPQTPQWEWDMLSDWAKENWLREFTCPHCDHTTRS